MKSNFILPFLFSCVALFAMAQNKAVVEAENYFNMGRYCEAAEKCADAYSKLGRKGEKAMILKGSMAFKTGECYRLVDKFKEANEWYDRALLLEYQSVEPKIYYYNGEMLRLMGKFDKALESYKLYKKAVPSDKLADIGITSCNETKNFAANKTRHVIVNQAAINRKEYDMAPMFADRKETKLYFSSSRSGGTGNNVDPISCENYMDIWVSEIDKKGNWGEPKLADKSGVVNTDQHEGSMCFDARGKMMFFTRCPNEKKQNLGCEIWTAELKGKDEWTDAIKLDLKSHDSVSIGHPCVSDDGKFLVFVANMAGTLGGKDLWYTTFDKKKGWATPKNLGPEINTPGNELFPTFGKDGSLYYATDGMIGLGGLDIFRAAKVGNEYKWENPTNLGSPINSESHDYALYELSDKKGYFTSERKDPNGKYNTDIYSYEMPPNLFDLKVIVNELGEKAARIADVKISVKGSDGSAWEGFTNKQGSVFWDKKKDSRFINENTTYTIAISKAGYYEDKKGQQFTTIDLNEGQNFIIEMALLPIKPIRLPEVRYPLNQWSLLVDSTINSQDSLLFVYNLLQEYPEMLLELSSHTDARGKDVANQKLAENRAKACYKYLVEEKGLDARRIIPVGKGESEPRTIWKKGDEYLSAKPGDMEGVETVVLKEEYINQFKTSNPRLYEVLHQYNRRTEGRVVNMTFDPATAPAANPSYKTYVKYP